MAANIASRSGERRRSTSGLFGAARLELRDRLGRSDDVRRLDLGLGCFDRRLLAAEVKAPRRRRADLGGLAARAGARRSRGLRHSRLLGSKEVPRSAALALGAQDPPAEELRDGRFQGLSRRAEPRGDLLHPLAFVKADVVEHGFGADLAASRRRASGPPRAASRREPSGRRAGATDGFAAEDLLHRGERLRLDELRDLGEEGFDAFTDLAFEGGLHRHRCVWSKMDWIRWADGNSRASRARYDARAALSKRLRLAVPWRERRASVKIPFHALALDHDGAADSTVPKEWDAVPLRGPDVEPRRALDR